MNLPATHTKTTGAKQADRCETGRSIPQQTNSSSGSRRDRKIYREQHRGQGTVTYPVATSQSRHPSCNSRRHYGSQATAQQTTSPQISTFPSSLSPGSCSGIVVFCRRRATIPILRNGVSQDRESECQETNIKAVSLQSKKSLKPFSNNDLRNKRAPSATLEALSVHEQLNR